MTLTFLFPFAPKAKYHCVNVPVSQNITIITLDTEDLKVFQHISVNDLQECVHIHLVSDTAKCSSSKLHICTALFQMIAYKHTNIHITFIL